MIKKVFVHCNIPKELINKLEKFFTIKIHNSDETILTTKELLEEASDYHALILQGNLVESPFIEKNKETLKVISNIAVGYDNIDMETATRYKIPVFNTPNILDDAVADLTMGLLISVSRKICEGHNYVIADNWKKNSWPLFWGEDFNNENLGIIGLGNIGKQVAKRASSFGFEIFYNNRKQLSGQEEKKHKVTFLKFEELLKNCKYIILTLPLNKSSYHLFNQKTFKLMRKDAYLFNVARGKIINEFDLVDALKKKKIMGAGLDVFEFEPEVNKLLYKLKNVVLLPHMGSATKKTRNEMMKLACNNLIDFVFENKLNNLVNKEIFQ